jgi:hypothetical protein
MVAILRQYELALWAIVSRPWTRFMLGLGLLLIGPALAAWLAGLAAPDGFKTEVPVVETSSGFGGFDLAAFEKMAREGRLGSVAKLDTKKVDGRNAGELVVSNGQFGFQLTRVADEPPGAWLILDQLPALEKLWMSLYDRLSEEGWRRIGEHTALEVLSLPDVESPDPATRERFPTFARAALERLPRLRELDLRGTGGSFELLLPPLPNLEVLAIGHGRLEENLRTLADGSPRLRVLAIQAWADMRVTPAMIESLKRMPNLRRVYVAETFEAEDEPAMRRQVAELRRALPGVAVHPGTYRLLRLALAIYATALGGVFSGVVWEQVSLLLATSLALVLPRRLAPHLFWAMAVSAACGGGIVGVLLSVGVAWMPALTLALLATMGTAGGRFEVVDGIAGRIPSQGRREMIILYAMLAYICANAFAPSYVDRWLSGGMPRFAAITLAAVSAAVAWELARKARIPRVLAGLQLSAPPGLVIDGTQGTQPTLQAGSFANWALKPAERGVDRQLSRPVPTSYAEKLRRSFPRFQILQTAVSVVIAMSGLMLSIRWALWWDGDLRKLSQVNPVVFPAAAWQACVMEIAASASLACVMAIGLTASMWGQRRESLVIDFLRPVSRAGYWQGLRKAIALDLVFPAVLGAACLGMTVGMSASGGPWAWGVAVILLIGTFAMTHAMILLLSVTRCPLVVSTLMSVLLVAAVIGSDVALRHVLSVSKPADLLTALVAAGAVLAVGVGIQIGVLWRLEEREIG